MAAGRQAPWGFFWLLPVIFVVSIGGGIWAVVTMTDPMVTTRAAC